MTWKIPLKKTSWFKKLTAIIKEILIENKSIEKLLTPEKSKTIAF